MQGPGFSPQYHKNKQTTGTKQSQKGQLTESGGKRNRTSHVTERDSELLVAFVGGVLAAVLLLFLEDRGDGLLEMDISKDRATLEFREKVQKIEGI
jgi:hypothetical protein